MNAHLWGNERAAIHILLQEEYAPLSLTVRGARFKLAPCNAGLDTQKATML